jgi:hypothetical protein
LDFVNIYTHMDMLYVHIQKIYVVKGSMPWRLKGFIAQGLKGLEG